MGKPQQLKLSSRKILTLARECHITDHVTGHQIAWDPNQEQKTIWKTLCDEDVRLAYFLKPRQIGASLATDFYDLVWAYAHDVAGHRVTCTLIWDTEEKLEEQFLRIHHFAEELEIPHRPGATKIRFPNGTRIIGRTAGGKSAGRGDTAQRFHVSELPFWPNAAKAWTGIQNGLGLEGECTVETTMDVSEDPLASEIWKANNGYKKVFFKFEEHTEYQSRATSLTKEAADYLHKEGFKGRRAMAWWWQNMLDKCAGDKVRALREYPQLERHAFLAAEGRWYKKNPQIEDCIDILEVDGLDGDKWRVPIWSHEDQGSGQYVIGVDTSSGRDLDRSVAVVVDKKTMNIAACFIDAACAGDQLAIIAKRLQEKYTVDRPKDPYGRPQPDSVPIAVIERNGVGEETVRQFERLGGIADILTTTEATRYAGLLQSRRFVDGGLCYGPRELSDECDTLHQKSGRFRGLKDLSMALGFCYEQIAVRPYVIPMVAENDGPRYKMKKPNNRFSSKFRAVSNSAWR